MSPTSTDRATIAALAAGRAASGDEIIEALHGFAQHIADAPDLNELLRSALLTASRLTGARHATALLLDDQAENIRYRVALDSGNLAPLELVAKPMMRRGLAGWVARERVAALIADTEQDQRWLPGPGSGDLRSAIVAPLLLGPRLLGMITLGDETPGHFSNEHLRLLEVFCAIVALAVEHAQVIANLASPPDPWSAPASTKLAPATLSSASPPFVKAAPEAGFAEWRQKGAARDSLRAGMGIPPGEAQPHPSSQTIVALSAELRGLSSTTHELTPAVLFEDVLDAYFARMDAIIRQNGGGIDRIAGDTLLAIFARPGHAADDAVGAAIQMHESATQLGAHWRASLGVDTGSLDIGIARGEAAIGSLSVLQGTSHAVGPVVNAAARLRELARAEILVAGDVAKQLHERSFFVQALQPLRLHGGELQPIFRVSVRP